MSASWEGRRLHIVGVGGAGMSAYARAAAALGATVSGSDRAASPYTEQLARDGVLEALIGHRAENVPAGADVEVVHSTAIPAENPEREAARARGLPDRSRAELLAELTRMRRTIAVAGAHGKTTTSAMIATALRGAGMDAGYLIGGTIGPGGRNGDWGSAEWLVVEADESDRSMLELDVEIAVLTSVELDHHATFGSLLELEDAYRRFLAPAREAVIWRRPELLALRGEEQPVVAYDVASAELGGGGARFQREGVEVQLSVPGLHNALNAAAALAVCRLVGVDLQQAAAALAGFRGAGRRFEHVGRTAAGASVYDDYAHHPTEIAATVAAARTLAPQRLTAIFQPHLFSRTQQLRREFGEALAQADEVVVLDVYAARERAEDFPGISGRTIAEAAADAGGGRTVYWLPDRHDAARLLAGRGEGELLMFMGAGDVDLLARSVVGGA